MAITADPYTQIVLLIGGLVAVLVGIMGRRVKNSEQEFKMMIRVISGLTGVVMLIWSFLMVSEGGWSLTWLLVFLVLGVGLLFPLLPRVNFGTILALIIAAVVAFALSSSMDTLWVVIIFLVTFFILWFLLGFVFKAVRGVGAILGSRIVLLVVGAIAIIMAAYSLAV
jgi:hypothetical protein